MLALKVVGRPGEEMLNKGLKGYSVASWIKHQTGDRGKQAALLASPFLSARLELSHVYAGKSAAL